MAAGLKRLLWDELLGPMLRRPRPLQIAALCRRRAGAGQEILLVTSKGTGRWLLPKGWPGRKRDAAATAVREAWEEAGLKGAEALPRPVGEFEGVKRHDSGFVETCRVLVYALEGGRLEEDWPEAGQRRRRWVSPAEAATMVEEPELRDFLAGL